MTASPGPVPSAVMDAPPVPSSIAGLPVPDDDVSAAAWRWAHASLPRYLLMHSIRSYCWGTTIGVWEGLTVDPRILWTAALFHDFGLTRIPRNRTCFEVEGAEIARRFVEREGMSPAEADRVAAAIVLHMRPGVTVADGVESLLLDRATAVDVRGVEIELVDRVRGTVTRKYPRGKFDVLFLRAIQREATARPTCQAARLLNETDLVGWMARSPWASES
jgi:HD domain